MFRHETRGRRRRREEANEEKEEEEEEIKSADGQVGIFNPMSPAHIRHKEESMPYFQKYRHVFLLNKLQLQNKIGKIVI